MSTLKKKFGLITAIAMVVGIVIGSGVFFKAEKILRLTGGNLPLAILAWIIGGLIMVVCAYTFAIMATKYEKVNGIVDYAEVLNGRKYGYYVGWFMTTIYYPTLTAALAWVSARYVGVLFGFDITGGTVMYLSGLFLILSYALNSLSPILAGKFQVATTVIKLIPLLLTAIVGTIVGLKRGITIENFTTIVTPVNTSEALFSSVCATAFAYEGWIIATSINSELKNAKKNLPRALIWGTLIIITVYVLYYIGLAGGLSNKDLIDKGANGVIESFNKIFGSFAGTALMVFVVISCLGTLNGLMLGCTRGMYALAVRNQGIKPDVFKEVDKKTDMPTSSAIIGLLLCGFWLLHFYGAMLVDKPWFGVFNFDSSELPIITIYAFYIPIFFMMIKKEKDLSTMKRYVFPAMSILGCILMMIAAVFAHKIGTLYYLIVFAVIMFIGYVTEILNQKRSKI